MIFLFALPYALFVIAYGAAWALLGEARWWVALLVNFAPYYFLPAYLLFPVALLLRARRTLLLLLPILVGGALLYGGYFVPKTTPSESETAWTLNIIALNVSDRLQPTERVIAWLRAARADVVVLAEARQPLSELVPRLLDVYPYAAAQRRNNGVAVLSRYPIRDAHGFAMTEPGYPRFPRVTLLVDDRPITLIATSLAAPLRIQGRILLPDVHNVLINSMWDMLWGYDDTQRQAEVTQILAQIDAADTPVIVAGDMNLAEGSADYRRLAGRLVDSYRAAATGFGFTFPAWEAFNLPSGVPGVMRLDYIWHTPDLATISAEIGGYVGSDHLPALATVGGS